MPQKSYIYLVSDVFSTEEKKECMQNKAGKSNQNRYITNFIDYKEHRNIVLVCFISSFKKCSGFIFDQIWCSQLIIIVNDEV